jgi:hypothetical protein
MAAAANHSRRKPASRWSFGVGSEPAVTETEPIARSALNISSADCHRSAGRFSRLLITQAPSSGDTDGRS